MESCLLSSVVSKLVEQFHLVDGMVEQSSYTRKEEGRDGEIFRTRHRLCGMIPGMCFLKWDPPPDFCHLQLYYILVTMSLPSSLLATICTKPSYSRYSLSGYCSHPPKWYVCHNCILHRSYYVTQASLELPVIFLHLPTQDWDYRPVPPRLVPLMTSDDLGQTPRSLSIA